MKVSVLGCGRWGSFISWYLNKTGHKVLTYGREGSKSFDSLKQMGQNEYLTFPKEIELCSDLGKALSWCDLAVISVPAQALREFASEIKKIGFEKPIILCMKGLEQATGKRLTQVMQESGFDLNNVCVWVGPGHIQDFLAGVPNVMMVDGVNESLKKQIVESFASPLIKFYIGSDLIGTEIGSATKNVIGVAAGMLDGLSYFGLKGALMCRGAREVSRLIKAMGGNPESAYGLCHLGDYEATLFSKNSHNRAYGEAFVKGAYFPKLAEGVPTIEAVLKMAEEKNVSVPITQCLHNIIFENKNPKEELSKLLARGNTKENN